MRNLSKEEKERLNENTEDAKLTYILLLPLAIVFIIAIIVTSVALAV